MNGMLVGSDGHVCRWAIALASRAMRRRTV